MKLASRPDIDQVVVIISNRCRHIPGTTKALGIGVAEKIWSIYLRDVAGVRVEVAPYSAVKHAIGYFQRVRAGDVLLFCAGESELDNDAGRFSGIEALSRKYGIASTVIAASVPSLSGRATAVRGHLADAAGYDAFAAALPDHLTAKQCQEVWQICHRGMQEMNEFARQKLREVFVRLGMGNIHSISDTISGKLDQVYCVRLQCGTRMFVKYANDTVKAAQLGQASSLKPRNRLYTERRALKWLARRNDRGVRVPEVIAFEKATRTLVLSEVLPGGHGLGEDLERGVFDPEAAWKTGAFLAQGHRALSVPPFWGTTGDDCSHWVNVLTLRTLGQQSKRFPGRINGQLAELKMASGKAAQQGFFHLDYCPKNVRLNGREMAVIDFELSSSIADPACDFGFLLGQYVFYGKVTGSEEDCLQALHASLQSYRQVTGDCWPAMASRTAAFAGAAILHCLNSSMQDQARHTEAQLLDVAATLLSLNVDIGQFLQGFICSQACTEVQ